MSLDDVVKKARETARHIVPVICNSASNRLEEQIEKLTHTFLDIYHIGHTDGMKDAGMFAATPKDAEPTKPTKLPVPYEVRATSPSPTTSRLGLPCILCGSYYPATLKACPVCEVRRKEECSR